jgi:hypothetical protein
LLRAGVVFINTKSSFLMTSLTSNTTYNLAKHQEMLYYLSSLSSLKTKHTVKEIYRLHVQWKGI